MDIMIYGGQSKHLQVQDQRQIESTIHTGIKTNFPSEPSHCGPPVYLTLVNRSYASTSRLVG